MYASLSGMTLAAIAARRGIAYFVRSGGIHADDAPAVAGEPIGKYATGHHRRCGSIGKNESDPFLGKRGVDGNIRCAGLQDAESANSQSYAAISQQSYRGIGADATQTRGELIGAMIELRIGELFIAGFKRHGFRRSRCLDLEQCMDATIARKSGFGIVPFHKKLLSFSRESRGSSDMRCSALAMTPSSSTTK